MRRAIVLFWMLLCPVALAVAQVSISFGAPGVRIGIDLPVYPNLVRVPGYPVYYAPQVNSNYFFYDGMYWVYQADNWYASSWYNGPWELVDPEAVPLFILRVPVRYYRRPPVYFHGWSSNAPPRWGEHWGSSWEQSRRGWEQWNRGSAPAPAPLPSYQRQYSGNRYPQVQQQQALQSRNYRYQPRDAVVQQRYQAQQAQGAPARSPATKPGMTATPPHRAQSAPAPAPQPRPGVSSAPVARTQPPQRAGEAAQKPAAVRSPAQQRGPTAQQHQPQQIHDKEPQGKAPAQKPQQIHDKEPQGKAPAQKDEHGQEKGRDKQDQPDGEHNK